MKTLTNNFHGRFLAGVAFTLALTARFVIAQTPVDEESPWPRVRSTNGNTVILHLPQVEHWTSNRFTARAAVGVKAAKAKEEVLGVVWFEAQGRVDRASRQVTLDHLEITKARFADALGDGSNELAIVREVLRPGSRTVSLDYLIAALGFEQAAARQGPQGLNHKAPGIIWATNRTVLVLVDGEPVLKAISNSTLARVVNTPALLVHDKADAKFYLSGAGQWFSAGAITGPWALAQSPPAEVAALSPTKPEGAAAAGEPPPRVIVSTSPAELLLTDALPDFRPIRGTALQYAADSDSQVFFHTTERAAYLLVSGRWFRAESLKGPWTYVAPGDLPADFAKIPANSPQAVVLASVPNTPQAELALVASSVPTTATVSRRETKLQLTYDGEPKFKAIEGTAMSYAINAQLPVIRAGGKHYALENGVWFVAASPTGPWEVATEVPEEIYTIPPSSPVYYATFARVYDADDENVEVGYTSGYNGAFENDGTVVYGTGWQYEPWNDNSYYGWGWTWGYGYVYVPWYQWWCWRPWWNERGGLRAAVIDNVYNRWWPNSGVKPSDAVSGNVDFKNWQGYSGYTYDYPATYGRYQGTTRPEPKSPPPNTLALNPYSRPQTPVRSGEIPHGAQLLTSLRQTPGGGRDLYASPDGIVYQRRTDGWYRRQASGNWGFAAPAQGQIERGQVASARGGQTAGGAGYRVTPGANASGARGQTGGNRVPNLADQPRAQDVAALQRQYYARSLGQMRTQNFQSSRNVARPVRAGGGRR